MRIIINNEAVQKHLIDCGKDWKDLADASGLSVSILERMARQSKKRRPVNNGEDRARKIANALTKLTGHTIKASSITL